MGQVLPHRARADASGSPRWADPFAGGRHPKPFTISDSCSATKGPARTQKTWL